MTPDPITKSDIAWVLEEDVWATRLRNGEVLVTRKNHPTTKSGYWAPIKPADVSVVISQVSVFSKQGWLTFNWLKLDVGDSFVDYLGLMDFALESSAIGQYISTQPYTATSQDEPAMTTQAYLDTLPEGDDE